jgi:hypothetical protein
LKILVAFLVFLVAVAAASAGSASRQTTLATFTGRCAKVTVMDVVADPSLCSDKVINIRLRNGDIGLAFLLNSQGGPGPSIISFLGTRPRHAHHRNGAVVLPVHRVYVTFEDRTDDLVALGSCAFAHPYKKTPAEVSCSANTIEGHFSGVFIGGPHDMSPPVKLADHHPKRVADTHILACGTPGEDVFARHQHGGEQCLGTIRR